MKISSTIKLACLMFVAFYSTITSRAHGQFLFSAFANGQCAYLAANQPGVSFLSNPAILSNNVVSKKVHLIFDADINTTFRQVFEREFPDMELWWKVFDGLCLSFKKQYLIHSPFSGYHRNPFTEGQKPLPRLVYGPEFRYEQNWSFGLGHRISQKIFSGLTLKREIFYTTYSDAKYWLIDIGMQWQLNKQLRFAAAGRNLLTTSKKSGQREYYYEDEHGRLRIETWDPSFFNATHSKPERYLEIGACYNLFSRFQILADMSTREEFAWGIRWRFYKGFHIVGGESHRYDQIYKKAKVIYDAIGFQFIAKRFQIAFSGIFPTKIDHVYREIETPYGTFVAVKGKLRQP